MSAPRGLLARLRRSVSGLATIEMALGLPFLLTAGLWGVELANYGVMTMRVNQLAIHIADNASRIGDTSMLANRKIYESDINDLLMGANIQAGRQLKFFDNGRVIISSLEIDPDDEQYIHWQRCMGVKLWNSRYGEEEDRLPNGMGPPGRQVITFHDEAVMFVELAYDYQPLVSTRFVGTPVITSIASFTVRSDRDLSGIFQRDPSSPDPVADCGTFTNPFAPPGGVGPGGSSGGTTSGGASSGGSGSSSGGGASSGGSSSSSSSSSGGSTTTTSGGSSTTSGGASSGNASSGGSSNGGGRGR